MNTYLGVAAEFSEADLDPALIAGASVLYLEGYLFDPPPAQAAFRRAAALARAAGRKVALSLSDPFCVERHREEFRRLLAGIDILFANEAEIGSLFETADFASAAERAAAAVPLAVLTRSERGSLILCGTERAMVPAAPTRVVDTTGAGDAYAAGFLAGYCRGLGLAESGWLGARVAAAVIAHFGARPLGADLAEITASLPSPA
jgi:fructokinase